MLITSKSNPKYRQWLQLAQARGRKQNGLFLIEGLRELSRAFLGGVTVECIIFSQTTADLSQIKTILGNKVQSDHCYILPDYLFKTLSMRENPDGILGVAYTWDCDINKLKIKPDGLYLLIENLEKPGNLGALLRSAEAIAVDAVLLADSSVDIFNPNVIRASQGAVFQLKIYRQMSASWLRLLRMASLRLFAATPHGQRLYWDCDLRYGSVICIGNEAHGLSKLWLQNAIQITIPMYGRSADSLNANVAGTLCLYEARRQRYKQTF